MKFVEPKERSTGLVAFVGLSILLWNCGAVWTSHWLFGFPVAITVGILTGLASVAAVAFVAFEIRRAPYQPDFVRIHDRRNSCFRRFERPRVSWWQRTVSAGLHRSGRPQVPVHRHSVVKRVSAAPY